MNTNGPTIIIADRQDITRAGLMYVCLDIPNARPICIEDKAALIESLRMLMPAPGTNPGAEASAVVILDYTLFDINDADELLIITHRFSRSHWILFSEELSPDFVRRVTASTPQVSILLKESPLAEIRQAINYALHCQRYLCQRMMELLLTPETTTPDEARLTATERDILKDIAMGMTTREIAEKRFSSFHTVNTHRKNIFRKINVNNANEATRYALRAGLVDAAEYYI